MWTWVGAISTTCACSTIPTGGYVDDRHRAGSVERPIETSGSWPAFESLRLDGLVTSAIAYDSVVTDRDLARRARSSQPVVWRTPSTTAGKAVVSAMVLGEFAGLFVPDNEPAQLLYETAFGERRYRVACSALIDHRGATVPVNASSVSCAILQLEPPSQHYFALRAGGRNRFLSTSTAGVLVQMDARGPVPGARTIRVSSEGLTITDYASDEPVKPTRGIANTRFLFERAMANGQPAEWLAELELPFETQAARTYVARGVAAEMRGVILSAMVALYIVPWPHEQR